MANYSNLKGKTPFDLFPEEVIYEYGWPLPKERIRERYNKESPRLVHGLALKLGNTELAAAVREQFPDAFPCCINPNL